MKKIKIVKKMQKRRVKRVKIMKKLIKERARKRIKTKLILVMGLQVLLFQRQNIQFKKK
ncbi:MAG: hypothetical protein AABW80_03965 [Nanoarchaeota archaeon]